MGSRLDLHTELLKFSDNVYYQPPSDLRMTYPCIVYGKSNPSTLFGNNTIYHEKQEYQLTLIGHDVDDDIPKRIRDYFEYSVITNYFTISNLNQVSMTLFY